MTTFLEKLTDDLLKKHNGDLSRLCLVFPTRRAGLFFKKIYSAKLTTPAWSPAIYAIEDFIQSLSSLQVCDQLDLVFELYEVYLKYFPAESFDRFYPWGVMLLKDFDDADGSMANSKQLFSYLSDIKAIDEQFDLAEEDKERLQNFWKLFFGKEHGEIKKNFLDNWKHLGAIYSEFKEQLLNKKFAYGGLAARTVAEDLKADKVNISLVADHYVFAGFNALTKAEEAIVKYFLKNKNGSIYYDSDEYFIDDPKQEAGTFIRKNSFQIDEWNWKETLLATDKKNIAAIGVPLQSLQAKIAGQILEERIGKEVVQEIGISENTAIVLPDEQLLIPVLYSLPSSISDLNVTMGYPLHASPLFTLIESLFELQKSVRNNPTSFYFKNVLSVLSHPYLQNFHYDEINKWMDGYRKDLLIRVSQEELFKNNSPLFKILFTSFKHDSLTEWLDYLNSFFSFFIETIKKNRNRIHSMEKEYVYYFYTRFKKLQEIILKFQQDISVETFRALFREVSYSTRIPFTGEPLKGLQIMGFLETRVLDFETVIILSMNEDVLPASSHHPSFIPFNIRKAFGLPTFEEQNAIAAYHFYRLLQRTKNIYLIYNTQVKSLQGGEKSRFILQIENELLKRNPNINYSSRTVNVSLKEQKATPITVKKTPDVLKELHSYLNVLNGNFQTSNKHLKYVKKFSASALIQYITCPLRFYLQYIAKLKEQEEPEENIESALFGKILHEAMNMIYKPFRIITEKDFEKIIAQVEKAADEAIKLHFRTTADRLEGKNILMRNVIIELLRQIVAFDRSQAPLTIRYLEKEFAHQVAINSNDGKVILYGIFDRVDEKEGCLRVVDYKTGRKDLKTMKTIDQLFLSPDYKEQFQAFFYSWLLKNSSSGNSNGATATATATVIKAGLFRLQQVTQGINYINDGNAISNEQFSEFESQLKNLLDEIFNPEIPFAQTSDEARCTYCAFKDICNR